MNIYPQVKEITYQEGYFHLESGLSIATKKYMLYKHEIKKLTLTKNSNAHLIFVTDLMLPKEAYEIHITSYQIIIKSSHQAGELWAIKTLKQIIKEHPENIPICVIKDCPELSIRGFMLDISRSKIPKMKTIYEYIDMMSDLKMNHFQLYVEGFSYYYASFPKAIYEGLTPLTEQDYRKIDRYCKRKGIDFVLNHNTFGHMNAWLAQDEYRDLAIMKDGMMMWGWKQSASTLNPLDSKSIDFIKQLLDDAVKGSTSKYFNICFDEAYELGHGPTKKACEKHGIESIFMDYLKTIVSHLKKHGKQTMMWGDFFVHYPEALKQLPSDVIVIDWGYDAIYRFDVTLKNLGDHKTLFLSAPGTSSWNSITGRTYDMLENIQKAIEYTKKYHGLGTVLTDWGDNGHLQYPIISYPAIVYTALESWSNHTGNQQLIKNYLNEYIYEDSSNQLGNLNLDLGRYQRYQKVYTHNGTELMQVLSIMAWASNEKNPWESFHESTKHLNYSILTLKHMKSEYEWMEKIILEMKKNIEIKTIFIKEFLGSINHVLLAIEMLLASQLKTYKLPKKMLKILNAHELTWKYRNQTNGLAYSMKLLSSLRSYI